MVTNEIPYDFFSGGSAISIHIIYRVGERTVI